jgi:hypothetical protein
VVGFPNCACGIGVVWIFHDLPSHASARNTWFPLLLTASPTASQKEGEAQDTAFKKLSVDCAGATGCCSCHDDPFHLSANGLAFDDVTLTLKYPTASHELALGHATACDCVKVDEAGLRIAWACHEWPVHVAAAATVEVVNVSPTASQNPAEVHATPITPPTEAGSAWATQADPFQHAQLLGVRELDAVRLHVRTGRV